MVAPFSIDALLPSATAKKATQVGSQKCGLAFWPLLMLAVVAGAFMYFIPIGLLIKMDTAFLSLIGKSTADYVALTWTNFFTVNLLPVTIGNLIGGVLLVGFVYWFIYLRPGPLPSAQEITGSITLLPVPEKRQDS